MRDGDKVPGQHSGSREMAGHVLLCTSVQTQRRWFMYSSSRLLRVQGLHHLLGSQRAANHSTLQNQDQTQARESSCARLASRHAVARASHAGALGCMPSGSKSA